MTNISTESEQFASLRVLLVEDDSFQRGYLVQLLRSVGTEQLWEAANGHEALQQVDQGGFDVVFLDLQMPGMDGVELLRHLGEQAFSGSVVLASGQSPELMDSVERVSRANGIRVLGSLVKPARREQVQELLALHLEEQDTFAPSYRVEEVVTVEEVREGLLAREFFPCFQPKVSFADAALVGVEALARWRRSDGEMISPGSFIPVVEDNGMVDLLTEIIFQSSLQQSRDWLDQGREIMMSVNLSPLSLSRARAFDEFVAMTKSYGVPPELVVLEVTESAIARDQTRLTETLVRLRMQGFHLSIDDFGTGHSSLEKLSNLPFTELKIDRSFVQSVQRAGKRQAIAASCLDLARRLNMKTVAEGVESRAEWDWLLQSGCDLCQGYFAGRPMPGDQVLAWERNWLARHEA